MRLLNLAESDLIWTCQLNLLSRRTPKLTESCRYVKFGDFIKTSQYFYDHLCTIYSTSFYTILLFKTCITIVFIRFVEKFGFPGVIGCIDGPHVAIIRLNDRKEPYFNRKNYHSLNVLFVSYNYDIFLL